MIVHILCYYDVKIAKVNSVDRPTCCETHMKQPRSKHGGAVMQQNEAGRCLLKRWEAESNPERLQKPGLWCSRSGLFFSSHPLQAQQNFKPLQCVGLARRPLLSLHPPLFQRENSRGGSGGVFHVRQVNGLDFYQLTHPPPTRKMLNLNSPLMCFCSINEKKRKELAGEMLHQSPSSSHRDASSADFETKPGELHFTHTKSH